MIHVDEEFKALIPPLSREEYKQLEENCVKEGIRDPLVVWKLPGNEILIDGHNRWEISAKHAGIRFNVVYKEFENREAVKEWIIKNQLGRRNIPPYVRAELALKLKPVIAEKAEKNLHLAEGKGCQKSDKVSAIDTKKELAKVAGVSHDTIHKVEVIKEKANELDPRTIEDLRRGDVSINKVYSDIKASEHENIRQQEARELREAKSRSRDYQDTSDKIASFTDAKQHKNDNELIFKEFKEEVRRTNMSILHTLMSPDDPVIKSAIYAADKWELKALNDRLSESYRMILKLQRKIAEVINEK